LEINTHKMNYHHSKYSHFTDHTLVDRLSTYLKKTLKKNQILFTSLTTILFLLLFVSCNRNKDEQLAILKHVIKSDTIFEDKSLYIDLSQKSLADMKFFNDSVFLYAIVFKNDSSYLKTYSIHDSIKLVEEKKLSNEMQKTIIDKKCVEMFIINSDSIIFSSEFAFYFYSISKDTIYNTIKCDENSYFSSPFANFYYDKPSGDIYSYYSDGSADYLYDIANKKRIVRYAKINETKPTIEKITIDFHDTILHNINLRHNFIYANELFINKSSFKSGFETYNTITKEYDYIEFPFLKKTIDNTNHQHNNKISYQNLKKYYMDSYIQQSLMYDYETQKIVLLYLKPVPERDENGLMPEFCFRKKNFYLFNNDFRPIGLIETKEDCFIPRYSFAINGKIHLLSIFQHKITLNTIEYELP